MKKLGVFVGLSLFFLFVVAGLPAHSAAKETLKIGMIYPLSGPAMAWGVNLQTTLEIISEEINSKGGLQVGNKVYEIKIIPYDDKYMPEPALTAANRLVYEDKVKYIFGPMASNAALAVQVVTEKEKILLLPSCFTRKGLGPDKPFTFRWSTTPFEYAIPEAAWIAKNRDVKSMVIIGPNSETGREGIEGGRQGFQKAGIKILAEEFYEPGAPDMLPLVTRLMRYNPDLIDFDGGSPGDVVNIAKTARAQGYKKLVSKVGGGGDVCYGAAPEALEGLMFNLEAEMTVTTGKQAELIAEVKRRKPQIPLDSMIPKVYTMFMMLAKAMQNAGTVEDTNAVRLALEKIDNFEGLGGKFGWTGKEAYGINHQLKAPIVFAEGVGGKIVTLAIFR